MAYSSGQSGDFDSLREVSAPSTALPPDITLLDGVFFMMNLPRGQEVSGLHGVRSLFQGAILWLERLNGLFVGHRMNCAPTPMNGCSSTRETGCKECHVEKDPDSYMQKWRATSNGLEYQGEQHNDCTLILDELGQMDAGNAAYMLADGMGKTRGKGAGGLRPKPTWRLIFLSSGELTLAQHMETVGKKMKGGQEVRLIPIPTEVREGSALETFHEFKTGHELSGFVQQNAARCYGTVGRVWLEYLVASSEDLGAALRERMDAIEAQIVPLDASGQVKRGGRRFALIAAAGEMATAAGLTGWPEGEAIRAAHTCFDAWLKLRGGAGSSDKVNMMRQVRKLLEVSGEGAFKIWHRGADDHAPDKGVRYGVRRMVGDDGKPVKTNSQHSAEYGDRMPANLGEGVSYEYFVFSEVFKTEFCKGFDVQTVCKVLLEYGVLTVKEPGRYSIKTKLPGIGPARCYLISPEIFDLDV